MEEIFIKSYWKIKESVSDELIQQLKNEANYSTLFLQLCVQRGLKTKEQIEAFLNVPLEALHNPFLMNDMKKTVTRIEEAIATGEKITIYGDYDADGVTSVVTLLDTLNMLGANVNYFIPHRVHDGYGPHITRFQDIIETGTKLIITVDNGVSGHEAIHWAMNQGVDVIVTDHHELPEQLPDAYAIVHPRHPDSDYPFKDLAGVGVAFKVSTALLGEIPYELMDLVAIGTIADLVSLTGENRALVQHGLKVLNQTDRLGIHALSSVCGIRLGEIDEESVGFQIAPRINAAGRLEDASCVVDLLTTWDDKEAQNIAQELDEINEKRKKLVEQITNEALDLKNQSKNTLCVVANKGWHEGVLGIVASRLVEITKKPAIVLTVDQKSKQVKGSARSVIGFNLFDELTELSNYLEQFGGHEMAAGLSLHLDQLQTFSKKFDERVESAQLSMPPVWIDEIVNLSELSVTALEEIELLKPFGVDNQSPIFAVKGALLKKTQTVGVDGAHLKLLIEQENSNLDVIAFKFGNEKNALILDAPIDVVGSLKINEWQGKRSVQMMMDDFSISKPLVYDERKMQLQWNDFSTSDQLYVVYNRNLVTDLKGKFPNRKFYWITSLEAAEDFKSDFPIVFVDCPPSLEIFKKTIKGNENQPWRLYFYKRNHKYIQGLPTREETSAVYKFIALHQNIPLTDGGKKLSHYVQVSPERTLDILKMFLEAGFVTIDKGILNLVSSPKKVDLTTTQTYQQLLAELNAEKYLIYSSFAELKNQLIKWIKELS